MTAGTAIFKCYRADATDTDNIILGAQVGATQTVYVADTKTVDNVQLVFIDTTRPQAGTYVVTAQCAETNLAFDTSSNISLLAIGP